MRNFMSNFISNSIMTIKKVDLKKRLTKLNKIRENVLQKRLKIDEI